MTAATFGSASSNARWQTGIIFSLFTVIKGYTSRVDVLPVIFRARSAAERAAGVARGLLNRPRPPVRQGEKPKVEASTKVNPKHVKLLGVIFWHIA